MVTRYFGFRVNTDPFEILAARLPLKIIRKHADQLMQVEALLYGTAGLLDGALFREAVSDGYYLLLSREYRVLRAKYSLQPVDGWLWKFHRLRPANFPTVRLSLLLEQSLPVRTRGASGGGPRRQTVRRPAHHQRHCTVVIRLRQGQATAGVV